MRILISGDPHVKISTIETGKKFLVFLRETIVAVKPDATVVLGDLFDTHAVMRVEVLNAWVRFLEDAHRLGEIYLMVGNHDKAGPSNHEHALVGLDRFERVHIVDRAAYFRDVALLPYYHTEAEFKAAVETVSPYSQFLCCHNTFDGAQYENGFYDPNGFSLETVARFKTVICGHVHKAQQLANVVYVGSPYDAGFQDAGEIKGLHLFDTETGEFKRIRAPLPHYQVLEFSSPDAFLENFEGQASGAPDDHYKAVVHGDRASISMMATDDRFVSLKSRFKLSLAPAFTAEAPRQGAIVQKAVTLDGMVDTYISDVMETSLDKARLADYARSMLNG